MSTVLLKSGAILVIAGMTVVVGYAVYYGAREFFADPSVPLAIKIAFPSIVVGVALLLGVVGWERYRKGKQEHFEEAER